MTALTDTLKKILNALAVSDAGEYLTPGQKTEYLSLRERFGLVAAGAVLLLYLMSFLRAFVREGYLAKTFVELVEQSPQDLTPLLLFVVTLVIGVALVAWMVRAALACRE